MNKIYKKRLLVSLSLMLLLATPLGVYAATDNESTTVNAAIASTISISTSSTVAIAVTPVAGGAQSSSSDTVSVSTNNSTGYVLTLADSDATTTLVSGANTIAAHTGTFASPTALANNSWGYAIPGGNFDATYNALNNATSSTTKWAGMPASGSPVTLKTTGTTASADTTTVWYSVKADTTKPNGTYSDTVSYTATTN